MDVGRTWFCNCSGKLVELEPVEIEDDEPLEPACRYCGATPSSDPKKTLTFRDAEEING